MAHQCSRGYWQQEGDKNTSIFMPEHLLEEKQAKLYMF
jgi:hypothetical protein